jgi:RHS repeat-associated protein
VSISTLQYFENLADAYRFGFNGKENDNEVYGDGNALDFGARIYDPRLGRWMSTDPLQKKYPGYSPYHSFANNPILFVDPDGEDIFVAVKSTGHGGDSRDNAGHAIIMVTEYKQVSLTINGVKETRYVAVGMLKIDNNIYYRSSQGALGDIQIQPSSIVTEIRNYEGVAQLNKVTGGTTGSDLGVVTDSPDFDENQTYYTFDEIAEDKALLAEAEKIKKEKPGNVFNTETYNCTDFVAECLNGIGINVSGKLSVTGQKSGRTTSVANPNTLFKELRALSKSNQNVKILQDNTNINESDAKKYIESRH